MQNFPDLSWFERLKESVNANNQFQQSARRFSGKIGWIVEGQKDVVMELGNGKIRSLKEGKEETMFDLFASMETWKELIERGTLVRLFRQGKIQILGDRVCAMIFWKMLWALTEASRTKS